MRHSLIIGLIKSSWMLMLVTLAVPAWGQLEPPSTGGVVALDHELRMLGHYKRVLVIGAHPDDEDTDLLTLLVRGMGIETAYLALNRGEGGQNLIGQELGPSLGLLRTEELLAARRLDGARQYFTRAYDFGFSKTLDETWQHWPRDTVLKDVVRIVRRFRPQIIISIFSGTPADGHGQHQAAGWAAYEAFRAAGDSMRFRELLVQEGLRPWTPQKFYRNAWFNPSAATLEMAGGVLDPATGRSYHQTAMAGRSLHRSQDMGRLQQMGPYPVRLTYVAGDSAGIIDSSLFTSVDTTLGSMPWTEVPGDKSRPLLVARVDSARRMLGFGDSAATAIAALLERAERDLLVPKKDSVSRLVLMTPEQAAQLRHLSRARAIAAGLMMDAVAQDDRVIPGQSVEVAASLWNAGRERQAVVPVVPPPAGWTVTHDSAETTSAMTVAPGAVAQRTVTLTVAPTATPTTPYFLRRPLQGAMYDWSGVDPPLLGEPFGPPELVAGFDGPVFGARLEREVSFRLNDQARGEVRHPVTVVPRVDVKLDPASELWSSAGAPEARRFTVTIAHGARDTTAGVVILLPPRGWPAIPAQQFRLTREDEQQRFTFIVRPPAQARGTFELRAVAQDERGGRYEVGIFTVDYPHIRARSYAKPAVASITLAPVVLPKLTRVGYVRGASDRVPEALRDLGLPLALLDASVLREGDLSSYDVIIVGPRAYEIDSALVANNDRLLDYARRGGVVIVQYQQQVFFRGGFAPYPLTLGGPGVAHDRVTDERAPVRVLDTADPVVTAPNRLEASDWEGWVQERGLYFARSWDTKYRSVLGLNDPGDEPREGGLLVAPVERGVYVYTGLSFFRQLPAGVPGAFRLFANLLALHGGRR